PSNIIGIDLGTTLSCVAIYSREKLELFENDCGLRRGQRLHMWHSLKAKELWVMKRNEVMVRSSYLNQPFEHHV
ncbi:hypothetical protein B4U80_06379, partial [Leptotrombidium deliense]